ncbi:hypothetical protein V1264_012513 [Littorina saxatilis]|uniref:ubiquitinyl hydrolase 1 n=2 Tax=Littorina saxatilis TaxID=31220 RepID=A0AAN9BX93_9CAEN
MPHIIPGGRQRASSDGDVLEDEDDTINASGVLDRLTEAHRNVSRSAILTTTDEDRDSDDPKSFNTAEKSNKVKKKSLKSKISFKSVKKAVSRAFPIKDSLFGSSSSLNKEEMPTSIRASSASGVWTPTSKRRTTDSEIDRSDGPPGHRSNRDRRDSTVTDSVSRPLITDPERMVAKWDRTPGNVGLFNHGNTCFMNAVLQCLSHTDSFTEYFITDLYKDDLKNSRNSSKKLGSKSSKGEVTEQLGFLLKALWSDKYNWEISIDFKSIVGKHNSQYKGSSQHDSQEFLLWLLDRIHEDLIVPPPTDRKKKGKHSKSTVANSRSHSQTDEELAEAAESSLTSSFVSKLFQGLHRSSLSCPHCNRLSNTFDPYLCVSLPLPQKCLRPVYVVLVTLKSPTQGVKMGLSLNMYDTVRELRDAVSADTGIPAEQIVLCELTRDGFYATFSNEQPLSDIPESSQVHAVEMFPDEPQRGNAAYQSQSIQLLLLHVERGRQFHRQRFCLPEVVQVSREADTKQLQQEILRHLGDAVRPEVFQQNLKELFDLQIVDGSSDRVYLPLEVEMPLYTQTVDRVLTMFGEEFGPQHVKLIVEWEPEIKRAIIEDDEEHTMEHASVNKVRSVAQQPVTVSLNECFQLYTQEEKLAGDDAWLCSFCKKPQKGATKTLGLWSLPEVLVLHLKRFKQTGMRRNKLNTLVEFPLENLDMSPHVVPHRQAVTDPDHVTYDLIAVANHYGNMNGGHYTAFSRNTVDGMWQEFDDRQVRPLGERQVVSKAAYILFYQRRSLSKVINQSLFNAQHWVFSLRRADKWSPQKGRGEREGSPVKRGGLQDDLEHLATSNSVRRVGYSNEWNGQSSPTRRPANRPLTPQPKRHQSSELSMYDQSPTAIKSRPSFRSSRPTLSRQMSDAAVRAKKQPYQEGEGTEREERGRGKGERRYSAGPQGRELQPQVLQVSLPPKPSPSDRDIMAAQVPKGHHSDILQPQQVDLPSQTTRDTHTSQQRSGVREGRDSSQPSQSSVHQVSQPVSVDVQVMDSMGRQGKQPPPPSSSSSQRDSGPSLTSRPWQYESQSSRSSHDTQGSQDSQHSPRDPQPSRSQYSSTSPTSNEFYDWRQPDQLTERQAEGRGERQSEKHSSGRGSPAKPATAITSRVNTKPPLPPKILTRPPDSRSDSSSTSSPVHRQDDYHVTVTTPSLTSPPSPAPKDSVRDIQRRLAHPDPRASQPEPRLVLQESRPISQELRPISQEPRQEPRLISQEPRLIAKEPRLMPQEARPVDSRGSEWAGHSERFIALSQDGQWAQLMDDADHRHMLQEGEFEKRRSKIASQIAGEQPVRRRKSQNLGDHKFATIGPCRDARSEPRDVMAAPMVPRSSTDHSIHFSGYGRSSPSHVLRQSPRHSTGYSSLTDRTSLSSGGSPAYSRTQWDRDSPTHSRTQWDRASPTHDAIGNVPLYARENRDPNLFSANKGHGIYRGPMFQHSRPKKGTGDIAPPSLRESSV